jgi:hypothetical protein
MNFGSMRALVVATWVVSVVFGGGCAGGGCSCITPMPKPIPSGQIIEGGAQVRVTPSGFQTLTSIVPAVLNRAVQNGFCIGEQHVGLSIAGNLFACDANTCSGGGHGCGVSVHLDSLHMTAPDAQTFRIDAQFDGSAPVHVTYRPPIIPTSFGCTINVALNDAHIVADVGFGLKSGDDEDGGGANARGGELQIQLRSLQSLDVSGLDLDASNCGAVINFIGNLVDVIADALSTPIGNALVGLLTPVINNLIQGFLPDPLGVKGLVDVGSLLSGIAPGIDAHLEVKGVPGGYVSLPSQGLSVGLIVGLNSDRNPDTRDNGLASESARCVPERPAPDYTGVLPKVAGRDTFALAPAGEFLGAPDPASDVAIGVSETVLDQAGFHVVNSGAMCLGVGSSLVPQLNLGTIGIIVQSLAALGSGSGKEPVMLVLRPQNPLDFTVGDGTEDSPRLSIAINDLEVDFYAYLFERYVRGFTVSLTLNLGLNLDFVTNADGKPAIQPTLLGLTADKIQVHVENAEFLSENPATLEAVFPSLFENLISPIIAEQLGSIALPDLQGFTLNDLRFTKIVTNQDDFLGIYAGLAAVPGSHKMAELDEARPFMPTTWSPRVVTPFRKLDTRARIDSVNVPAPEVIGAALARDRFAKKAGEGLPEVTLALASDATPGTPVEYSWRLDNGLWHEWSQDAHPVLREKVFALQGRHTLYARSRQVGDYRTDDETPVELPLVIDSAPPRLLADRTAVAGEQVTFVAADLVTADADLRWAFATPGEPEDELTWRSSGTVSGDELRALADDSGDVLVLVRDEKLNVARTSVDVGSLGFHGRAPSTGSGCSCDIGGSSTGRGGAGGLVAGVLAFLALLPLLGRRRVAVATRAVARQAGWIAFFAVCAFGPACGCGDKTPPGERECTVDADCADFCGTGKIGRCDMGMCYCEDDIEYGKTGTYSDLAVAPTGEAWVSAYNATHGDLMVAKVLDKGRIADDTWEFVDGVPDGPVALPNSTIRHGVRAPGDDVGLYTSIAVGADSTPRVSYYDVTHASLRYAARAGGTWTTMVVDEGAPLTEEIGGEDAGRYSAITINPLDGKPGIAYLATVVDGANARTELRFAQASSNSPAAPSDWTVSVVDGAAVPPLPAGGTPPADLPEAVGLFIAAARMPDGGPILAYYDRINGDLKVARYDVATSAFLAPEVIDGADGADVGQYPSITVDADSKVHISYVDASHDNLLYVNLTDKVPEVIDDGYRIDGTTEDGLPRPVFHLVGDDSGIVTSGAAIAVAYQDSTTHELRLAVRDAVTGTWKHDPIAGAEDPYVGGYGFYAAAAISGTEIVMSSYVIDNLDYDFWVEVFRQPVIVE